MRVVILYSRYDYFLKVIEGLFTHHNNGELYSQLSQTARWIALQAPANQYKPMKSHKLEF